jgi:acyl-CoA synthetase (NDP forming)
MADYFDHVASARPPGEVAGEPRRLPGSGPVLEPDAMDWLAANGVPVPAHRFATTAADAAKACAEVGYPAVMKVVSPQIVHKSDVGGVVLGIVDEAGALAAFERMRAAAAGRDFRGVVVYPMIGRSQEVLVGLSVDPQFGPVIVFGLGGIYAEIWRDIAMRVAPVEKAQAEAMIRELRSYPLLAGARGQEPVDLDGLANLLVAVSRMPFLYPEIGEMDLNPVFVSAKGAVVGDVRVIRKG